jgi:hypothetical protein
MVETTRRISKATIEIAENQNVATRSILNTSEIIISQK